MLDLLRALYVARHGNALVAEDWLTWRLNMADMMRQGGLLSAEQAARYASGDGSLFVRPSPDTILWITWDDGTEDVFFDEDDHV